LESCVSKIDDEFEVNEKFENKTGWKGNYPPYDVDGEIVNKYGVQGSPTLIINGAEISSGRDSQSLLSVVCSAFNETPEECETTLDSATPSAGFGAGTATSSGGGCGG